MKIVYCYIAHIIDKRNSHIYYNNTLYMIKFSVLYSSINSKEKSVPCTSHMHNYVIFCTALFRQYQSMLFMMVSLYIIKYHRLFIVMCTYTACTVQCVRSVVMHPSYEYHEVICFEPLAGVLRGSHSQFIYIRTTCNQLMLINACASY